MRGSLRTGLFHFKMLPQDHARVSGPCLSDGRVRTDEIILAENEGRKVLPAGASHRNFSRARARKKTWGSLSIARAVENERKENIADHSIPWRAIVVACETQSS